MLTRHSPRVELNPDTTAENLVCYTAWEFEADFRSLADELVQVRFEFDFTSRTLGEALDEGSPIGVSHVCWAHVIIPGIVARAQERSFDDRSMAIALEKVRAVFPTFLEDLSKKGGRRGYLNG